MSTGERRPPGNRPPGDGDAAGSSPAAAAGELDAPGSPGVPGSPGGVLVIGYGNVLRSDDGVGVHAAGRLARDPRLARVDVRAVVQLAPELAADFAEMSLVVLVDASVDAAPGQVLVRRLGGDEVAGSGGDGGGPDGRAIGSLGPSGGARPGPGSTSHHVGAEELVAIAGELYGAAPEVVVVSVGVATFDVGESLSPAVAAALPDVADAVAELVASRWGR